MNPLRLLWRDRCTVTGQRWAENPVTHLTESKRVILAEEVPCKLSFEGLFSAKEGQFSKTEQKVKLFLPLDAEIPAGSRVTVTRPDGRVLSYRCAGLAGEFSHHREVLLESGEERA